MESGSLTSVLGENLPLEILSFSASRMAYFDSGSSISLMEMSSMHQLSATSLASFDMASVVVESRRVLKRDEPGNLN